MFSLQLFMIGSKVFFDYFLCERQNEIPPFAGVPLLRIFYNLLSLNLRVRIHKKSPPSKWLCSFEALSTHRGPVIFNMLWNGTPPVTVPSRARRDIVRSGRFLRAAALPGGSRIFHTPGSPGD